ncbi:TIGR01777 family oxidoreductase [Tellurirhabdus bombi]|uniref:TIGR01777 family oxidoreductase n=1 Tax=Tellurirhabdus bombi TaxID=2907205 RepID=UPI001F2C37E1|nr:TIGR01777 family oxidoreductase [Tellurirhabdus bombi]
MPQTVLITGGTGTVGRPLTRLLQAKGYQVSYLSRSGKPIQHIKVYQWDPSNGRIDAEAVAAADYIIHLAGAGIADSRWTDSRKREILQSRTQSTDLLVRTLAQTSHKVKAFISSSAIGYYGGDTGNQPLTENSAPGKDFMAEVTVAWEQAAEAIAHLGIRTVKLRIGVVLSVEGGALSKLIMPVKWGVGSPLGSGQQHISWIHIDDLCRLFLEAMESPDWQGVYNAVAPAPVTNETLTRHIAEALKKPLWLPNIPAALLRLILGEMAVVILGSSNVQNKRIKESTDFNYLFKDSHMAICNLLNK